MSNPVLNALGDDLLYGGTVDPTVDAIDAPKGAVYIYAPSVGAPSIFQKQDNGNTTNWTENTGTVNTDLSNLTAPTAINESLLPDTDCALDLGSAALRWDNIFVKTIDSDNQPMILQTSSTVDINSTGDITLNPTSNVISASSSNIEDVLDPVNAQDAATKNYVDTNAGADKALSNLAAVSINTSLIPSSPIGINLGSSTIPFFSAFVNSMDVRDPTQVQKGLISESAAMPTGAGANLRISSIGPSGILGLISENDAAADASATGDIKIQSGNKTAGTGDSGNIEIRPGTSSGGTRGTINFVDGSEGTPGDVWTSTGAAGEGAWATPASGGATTALDNLASVAINTALLPDADGTIDLGDGSSFRFRTLHLRGSVTQRSYDSSGNQTGAFQPSTSLPSGGGIGSGFLMSNQKSGEGFGMRSKDDSGVDTGSINLYTGAANNVATDSGTIVLETGAKTGTSTSGQTGDITLKTGGYSGANAAVSTGSINLTCSDPSGAGTRGDIVMGAGLIDMSDADDGIVISTIAGDPSAPADGTFWYNTVSNDFKGRVNGITVTFTVT